MSQKQSIIGSKIDFRVRQSCYFLIFNVPQYVLLDFKKHCQAFPSTSNPIPAELPILGCNNLFGGSPSRPEDDSDKIAQVISCLF